MRESCSCWKATCKTTVASFGAAQLSIAEGLAAKALCPCQLLTLAETLGRGRGARCQVVPIQVKHA